MAAFAPVGSGPVGVGFVGVGVISDTYLENINSFPDIEVLILGDLLTDRAASQAEKHGIAASGTTADVLAHPGVELVVNLTVPAVHVELVAGDRGRQARWSEKPIGIDRDVALTCSRGGCRRRAPGIAPDTVLGAGIQTAKRAIARGDIGAPAVAATASSPGSGGLPPEPGVPVRPWRRSAVRHGPVLLHDPRARVRAGRRGRGRSAEGPESVRSAGGPDAGTKFQVEVSIHDHVLLQFGGRAGAVDS